MVVPGTTVDFKTMAQSGFVNFVDISSNTDSTIPRFMEPSSFIGVGTLTNTTSDKLMVSSSVLSDLNSFLS